MDLSNDSQCSMSSLILEILLSFPALGSTMLDSFFWLVIKKKIPTFTPQNILSYFHKYFF